MTILSAFERRRRRRTQKNAEEEEEEEEEEVDSNMQLNSILCIFWLYTNKYKSDQIDLTLSPLVANRHTTLLKLDAYPDIKHTKPSSLFKLIIIPG